MVRFKCINRLQIIVFVMFLHIYAFSQNTTSFNTAGADSWTAPTCVSTVTVEIWGAGGGAGGNGDDPGGGAAGGGGAYSRSVVNVVTGTSYNLNVGAAGTAGNNSNGGDGGDSWFLDNTTVMAKGGVGGRGRFANGSYTGGAGGAAADGFGTVKYSGGDGGGTYGRNAGGCCGYTSGGGGGSSAGPNSDGVDGGTATGNGTNDKPPPGLGGIAPAGGGNGGDGRGDGNTFDAGFPGEGPGGGGGGSDDHGQGALGAPGQVILTWAETSDIGSNPVASGDLCPNSTDVPIHSFTTTCGTTMTDLDFVTTGTYAAAEVTNFKLYYTTTNTFATTNLVSTITVPATAGTQTFPSFNLNLATTPYYFWITMDVAGTVTEGNTLTVGQTAPTNMTITGVDAITGSGNASSEQTLRATPSLTSTLTPPAICGGETFNYIVTNDIVGSTFAWSRTTVAGIPETGTTGNGDISEILSNTTTDPINVTYDYTTTSPNGCSNIESVVLVVNPGGVLSSTKTPPSICSGVTFDYEATSATTGATFAWSRVVVSGISEGADSGVGDVNEMLTNTTNNPINVTYEYITSYSGCDVTEDVVVEVINLPTASVGPDTTICLNDPSPAIIFTGFDGTSPYFFDYNLDGGGTQTISTLTGEDTVSVYLPSTSTVQTYVYTLETVIEGSSNVCSQAQTGSASIVVGEPLSATLTSTVTRVCEGAPEPNIVFEGAVGPGPYTFAYSTNIPVNGATTHTVQTENTDLSIAVFVPTNAADTITFTITGIADATGVFGCINGTISLDMIIDPLPQSTITSPGGADQCFNQPGGVELTFTGINVVGQVTFNYTEQYGVDYATAEAAAATTPADSPLGPITVGTNSVYDTTIFITAGAVGTTIYSNGISNSNVCTGSGDGTASITVNPLPEATLALTGVGAFCENATGGVEFTGSIGVPPFTFTYDIDGGVVKTVTSASGAFTAGLLIDTVPGTYTINLLSVSDAYSCNQAQAGAVTVTLDPLPVASAGGSEAICMTGTANVTGATLSDGTINWTHDGVGTLNNPTTLTPSYEAGGGDAGNNVILTMTVTSDNTCNPEIATAIYTVRVDSLPLAQAGGVTTICENTNHTVAGTIARFGTIAWTHDGVGTLTNGTTATPTYTAAAGDAGNIVTLTITVTSNNSCAPQTATDIETINVDPLPTAVAGGNTTICEDATYQLQPGEATATNGTINWTVVNGQGVLTNSTTFTPIYTAVVNDKNTTVNLLMTVTSDNSCESTISSCVPAPSDLISWVSLDNGGEALEGPDGVVFGAVSSSGKVAGAYSFNGGNNYIDMGSSPIFKEAFQTFSIDAWVKPTQTRSRGTIVSNTESDGWAMRISNGQLEADFRLTGGNVSLLAGSVPLDVYSFVALTYDGSTVRAYVNGVEVGSVAGSGVFRTSQNSNTNVFIGNEPAGNAVQGLAGFDFIGEIDEVEIFDKSLSSTEVQTLFNAGSGGKCKTNGPLVPETATASYDIIVDPLPTATAGGLTTICQDGSYTLGNGEASLTGGTPSWDANGGFGSITAGGDGLTPTYSPGGTTTGNSFITMTVSSNNACAGATAQASYNINVDRLPTAVAGGNATICENSTYTLGAGEATPTEGTPFWTADGAGSITAGADTQIPTYTPATGDAGNVVTLTMTVSSDNACVGNSESAIYEITVDPLPKANSGSILAVCKDSSSRVVGATASPANNTITWTHNGDGTLSPFNSLSPTYAAVESDAGKIIELIMQVNASNACGIAVDKDSTTIDVRQSLTASIILQAEACLDEEVFVVFKSGRDDNPNYSFTFREDANTPIPADAVGTSDNAIARISTDVAKSVRIELLSMTDGNCTETFTDSAVITIHKLPSAEISEGASYCEGDKDKFEPLTITGQDGKAPYFFDYSIIHNQDKPNAGKQNDSLMDIYEVSLSIPDDEPGVFYFSLDSVRDANNCIGYPVDTAIVTIHEIPEADFIISPQQTSILEPTINIVNISRDIPDPRLSNNWDFGDGQTELGDVTEYEYKDTGTYKLTLTQTIGSCVSIATQVVIIDIPLLIYVPQAFTPNEDGINETFAPKGDGIDEFEMEIYNRWGNMIFYTNDLEKGWDGKANGGSELAQIDAYIYVINVVDTRSRQSHTYRGILNLMR